MVDVAFYHLQSTSMHGALPQLLSKSLERGWRAVVEVGARDALIDLDTHLWTFSDAVFLPHGSIASVDGNPEPHGDRQPVWLTTGTDNPNQAKVRFFLAGAMPRSDVTFDGYERLVIMFDGADAEAVTTARSVWRALRDVGHSLSYWQQADNGSWRRADT